MERPKNIAGDLFFIIQVCLTVFFCTGQFLHMWRGTVHGILVTMFVGVWLFLGINLILALRARRHFPTRASTQVVFVYSMWTILWGANVSLFFLKGGLQEWGNTDSAITGALIFGFALLWALAHHKDLSVDDGVVRGWMALLLKAVPQFGQAVKISLVHGAPGIGLVMVIVGHLTIVTRLAQLVISARKGWDRNLKGIVLSEIGNELSWVTVTVLWIIL